MKTFQVIAALCCLSLLGCPSPTGAQGDPGPQGPAGAPGAIGPPGAKGDKGDKGDTGAPGFDGAAGPQGPQGAQGAQGLQGPAGTVLVVDGGVITGPAGASVLVTTITAGGATCPTGGVRITQLSDGGLTNVCNGAQGPQGVQGLAGPQGVTGFAPTATTLANLSPACMTGGVLITIADGGTFPICNGAQGLQGQQGSQGTQGIQGMTGSTGAQGPIGLTGAAGPTGPTGPAGPQGSAGAVLYLDGGAVVLSAAPYEFAGFTPTAYTGDLGGYPGANQKCAAAFAGSYFCTIADYDRTGTPIAPPTSAGAWIDFDRKVSGGRADNSCSLSASTAWTSSSNSNLGANLNATGGYYGTVNCANTKPLACCRGGAAAVIFRGFTTATFTGDLGGYPGANAKCQTQYAGSTFCTIADYDLSNTTAAPPTSAGAWIDFDRKVSGARADNSCSLSASTAWTSSSNSNLGANLNATGGYYGTVNCANSKPLACCQNR